MNKFLMGILVGMLISCPLALASILPSPPIAAEKQIKDYLGKIRDGWNNVEITATNPNGSRMGKYQDIVIFNDSGTYRWRVCTSTDPGGGTTWVSIGS